MNSKTVVPNLGSVSQFQVFGGGQDTHTHFYVYFVLEFAFVVHLYTFSKHNLDFQCKLFHFLIYQNLYALVKLEGFGECAMNFVRVRYLEKG